MKKELPSLLVGILLIVFSFLLYKFIGKDVRTQTDMPDQEPSPLSSQIPQPSEIVTQSEVLTHEVLVTDVITGMRDNRDVDGGCSILVGINSFYVEGGDRWNQPEATPIPEGKVYGVDCDMVRSDEYIGRKVEIFGAKKNVANSPQEYIVLEGDSRYYVRLIEE
jgi:hypothetical protein